MQRSILILTKFRNDWVKIVSVFCPYQTNCKYEFAIVSPIFSDIIDDVTYPPVHAALRQKLKPIFFKPDIEN